MTWTVKNLLVCERIGRERSISWMIHTIVAREREKKSHAIKNVKVRRSSHINPNSSEPLSFGNWTYTSYCNDTCGDHSYYLMWRSCTPVSPNLPEGYSCNSLDWSETHKPGEEACRPFIRCPGRSTQHPFICPLSGTVGPWSDWSDCKINCSQYQQQGEMTRNRTLHDSPPETQTQTLPCYGHCPLSRKGTD